MRHVETIRGDVMACYPTISSTGYYYHGPWSKSVSLFTDEQLREMATRHYRTDYFKWAKRKAARGYRLNLSD